MQMDVRSAPSSDQAAEYIWGFDLGVGSLGWSVIRPISSDTSGKIVDCGVRIFPATVDAGDLATGREEAPGKARRQTASMRRQREYRRERLIQLAHLLQATGLLPQGDVDSSEARDRFWKALDARLAMIPRGDTTAAHTWLYRLAARGLTEPLEPHAIGRVLYFAAQLRGFKSNRKDASRDRKEHGAVKDGIKATQALALAHGTTSLASTFAQLDPEQPGQRIRGRYTARQDREADVKVFLARQQQAHPAILTPELCEKIHQTIFFQRSYEQDTSKLVGRCALLGGAPLERRRDPIALPSLQRLRVLQKVNDLEVIDPNHQSRTLPPEDRQCVRDRLLTGGDLTFAELRKLLGLPAKPRKGKDGAPPNPGYDFNLAAGGETKLVGERTFQHLHAALGDKWAAFKLPEQDELVGVLLGDQDDEIVAATLQSRFGLSAEEASAAVDAANELEADRGQFCAEAAQALCERMGQPAPDGGPTRLATALKQEREAHDLSPLIDSHVFDRLPPLVRTRSDEVAFFDDPTHLRNPVILRALAELRLVANALLRRYGKPALIRLELIRDLKKPRSVRANIADKNREREADREGARRKITSTGLVAQPSGEDIDKWLLAEECHWQCPYTGQTITPQLLFGPSVEFQIEHIVPRSRSLDNSFANKTLCQVDENLRKHNRTPLEAYGSDVQRWHEVLRRVRSFQGAGAAGKFKRFQWAADDLERIYGDDFTRRHLQDTAWASRLAADYLGTLFGGTIDAEGRRRVQTVSGTVTGLIRQSLGLSAALLERADLPALPPPVEGQRKPGAPDKLRADHRHHAIDAVVIALTTPTIVQQLSRLFEAGHDGHDLDLSPPWPELGAQLRACLDRMIVSHRVDRRANGPLHDELFFQKPRSDGKVAKRFKLADLGEKDFEAITNSRIRSAVIAAWESRPDKNVEPGDFFGNETNLPQLKIPNRHTRVERMVPIRRVTVSANVPTVAIGQGTTERRVKTGANFCVAVVETPSSKLGRTPKLRFEPITLLDATRLIARRSNKRFTLTPSDMLRALGRLKDIERVRFTIRSSEVLRLISGELIGVFVVGTASDGLEVTRLNDARSEKARRGNKKLGIPSDRIRLSPSALLSTQAEKIVLGPLGEISVAHD
jgi:CRISPR-associated endonuclease Csn1